MPDQQEAGPQGLITQAEAAERRLEEHRPAPPPAESGDAAELIAVIRTVARDPSFDVEKLRELRAIHKEWQAEQNEKAFFDALARAQAKMPVVAKNKNVSFGEGAKKTDYWHADLGALVAAVKPVLASEGLAFGHDVTQENGTITVSCVLRGYGHSERVTLSGTPDASGNKNSIQQTKSTVTYLRRATLEMVTGAATKDDDDDGRGFSQPELIGVSELAFLNAEITEIGDALDLPKFLEYLGVESIEELPSAKFGKAKQALATKRRKLAEETAPAEDAEPEPHELLGAG